MSHLYIYYYKWLNYYVRMSKTSPCTPMSVFYAVLSGGGTQHQRPSAARRRHSVGDDSELRKHPKHGFKC